MCEKCGNPDCPGDRFNVMPQHAFHQMMMMILGDMTEKLTEQCIIQQRINGGEPLPDLIKEMEANENVGDVGPRYILLAYKAAGSIINKLEEEFNMKSYESNDEIEALNQPKIQHRFWELLSAYMSEHHIIPATGDDQIGQFSIDDLVQPKMQTIVSSEEPLREGQQEAINQAVDEMIMKPTKKQWIH